MLAVEEKTFATHDGVELFYRYWPAVAGAPKGAILLFHRGHEHSGRMAHLADEFDLPDFAVFAWDARGHGRSPGARADEPGSGQVSGARTTKWPRWPLASLASAARGFSPSLATSVRDVQTFVDHIAASYGIPVEQ